MTMTRPLQGVRVLDLGTMITAPLAGMMLGDLGADVIKVERPEGDPFRSFRGGLYSPHFVAYNRSKRSVVLDLQKDKGRAAFRKLIATADVMLDNFRPGVLDRLGFGAEALMAEFSKLICCSITGFGPNGPYRDRPAFDAVASGLSGLYSVILNPEQPRTSGPTIVDNIAGMYACHGILAALFSRAMTGKGARIETNMLEAAISFIPDPFANEMLMGIHNTPRTRVATSQSFAFTCLDEQLIVIHLSSPVKFWEGLVKAIERPDLLADPRFVSRDLRVKNFELLEEELGKVFITRSREEWMRRLLAADIPFAQVQSLMDVVADPQVKHLKTFYSMKHPTEGKVTGINLPIWVDGSREHDRLPPPALGEHSEDVLAACGYSAEDIETLRAEGVI
ncbi:MAG: CaiB/BaiF CoA transferase family protein [Xanthobacteraceae bacterium]